MLANLFWGLILKDFIEVQEKKKQVLVLPWRSPQNVNLGPIFTSQSCSDGNDENFFLILNLDMVSKNSIPGGFAYISQNKWVGIIPIKT